MGLCCSCCRSNNERAFKSELDAPLIRDVMSSLPASAQVVVLKVLKVDRIEGVGFSNTADPYVEMRLAPPDGVAGEQVKITSKRPQTITPEWDPPEKFQYIVSNVHKSKIVFSVFHFNGTSDPTPLGDGALSLKDLTEESQELKVRLMDPSSGKPGGEVCTVLYCTVLYCAVLCCAVLLASRPTCLPRFVLLPYSVVCCDTIL
jgi:hypothetical protein